MEKYKKLNITDKPIHLGIMDNIIEDVDVKVSDRIIRRVEPHWHDFYEIELILDYGTKTEINGKVYDAGWKHGTYHSLGCAQLL